MLNEILSPSPTEQARPELKSYNVTIPMESLAIGVDNIHHDVFLSPKFVQIARDYLFDVIRHSTSNTYLAGLELREIGIAGDRKSTRLNSSHRTISYAVFCLKKKNFESAFDA